MSSGLAIAPSLLSSDFARLAEESNRMVSLGATWLHVDVMDGHFVPNLTLGAPIVASLRAHTAAYLDCHLMVSNPEDYVESFAAAGADGFTFHYEATKDAASLVDTVKKAGMRAGVAIKPGTPLDDTLQNLLPQLDLLLVMTVEPGFGGQSFQEDNLAKVKLARSLSAELDIEVDGGLNEVNVVAAAQAGANCIVAGSSIFKSKHPARTIQVMKKAVLAAAGK